MSNDRKVRTLHNLQAAREAAGLSIADLSELSDISESAIRRIEGGKSPYKTHVGVAAALATALNVAVGDLFDTVHELSDRGRPPMTGKPITKRHLSLVHVQEKFCQVHRLRLPQTGICDDCAA